eukprot:3695857-Prymnesium_polylepis.2
MEDSRRHDKAPPHASITRVHERQDARELAAHRTPRGGRADWRRDQERLAAPAQQPAQKAAGGPRAATVQQLSDACTRVRVHHDQQYQPRRHAALWADKTQRKETEE